MLRPVSDVINFRRVETEGMKKIKVHKVTLNFFCSDNSSFKNVLIFMLSE